MGNMIRPTENNRMIYELLPNLSVRYADAEVTTNARGFRGREYSLQKDKNVVRILGLGDSIMFGQGVDGGINYLSLLEEKLDRDYGEKKWEVINTAIPGYNTVMEIEALKEKGLAYKPDIVIVGFCNNDLDLPNFIQTKKDYFSLKTSFFLDFIYERVRHAKETFVALDFAPEKSQGGYENDPALVPAQYRDMVGWNAFERAMAELKDISTRNNFDVVICFLIPQFEKETGLQNKVSDLSRRLSFCVIDIGPVYNLYLSKKSTNWTKTFAVSSKDAHPNKEAHKIAANLLIENMSNQGLINKRLSDTRKQ